MELHPNGGHDVNVSGTSIVRYMETSVEKNEFILHISEFYLLIIC